LIKEADEESETS